MRRPTTIACEKMSFRIESQRDADKIAQGATLGSVSYSAQALKGRDKLCFACLMSPLQGWPHGSHHPQGCTLGYRMPLRWSLVRKFLFLASYTIQFGKRTATAFFTSLLFVSYAWAQVAPPSSQASGAQANPLPLSGRSGQGG